MKPYTTIILLAGGESTRLWPFANKNMTKFLGKPLIAWHYEQFVRIGVANIIVVTNKENEKSIQAVLPPHSLSVHIVVQKGKGQGQAIIACEKKLPDGPVCVINGSDIYDDLLFRQLGEERKKHANAILLGCLETDTYFPGGYLRMGADGNVLEIVEKPKPGTEPSSVVRIVADVFPDAKLFLLMVKKSGKDPNSGYEKAVNMLIKKEGVCRGVVTKTSWLCLKYPWHILSLTDASLGTIKGQYIAPSATIAKGVVIEGPVIVEDDVKIFEGTKIVGPTYIGAGTIIGNNNIIRRSHIGSFVVTGFNTDITRSYIGNNSWFHSNYIGDSVIGENVSMGSGSVCANLRLDESTIFSSVKGERIDTKRTKLGAMIGDSVRIGVNVSIMPGIKIGQNSFVGAGVILGEDLPDGKYCRIIPSVAISDNTQKASSGRDEFRKSLK